MTRIRKPDHRRRGMLIALVPVAFFLLSLSLQAYGQDPFSKTNEARSVVQNDPFSPANQADNSSPAKKIQARKRETPTTALLAELIQFKAEATPATANPGQVVKITITGMLKEGYHTYPATKLAINQQAGQLSRIEYDPDPGLKPLWPITETQPVFEKASDGGMELVHEGKFTWSQDVLVPPDAKPGLHKLLIRLRLMVCDKTHCVGPGSYRPFETAIDVVNAPAVPLSEALKKRLQATEPPVQEVPPPATARITENKAGPLAVSTPLPEQAGLWGLLVSACVGAFLMLLTPCVFPMIPITVNFFLKQSEKEHHNPLLMASVYAGTIIFLLTLVMVVLGSVVVNLANSAWFNLLLGGVLFFFALSLLGMYEVQLPSSLARFTSAREGQGGYAGAVFMALTFTITSFTCTGPFLGALLGGVAGIQPPKGHLILAALVYSATFAAPFFLLALFPSLLRKLPKSGGWLNAVKVAMGFLEIGAALKFLSNTDLAWNPGNPRIFTYDAVLCAWIALSFACGLYLIGAFRLPHDDPADHIGVVRMILATIFFGFAVYMTPALRRETPQGLIGEVVVALLPPSFENASGGNGSSSVPQLAWYKDYEAAWQEAKRENKLIFIDFTGQNCTNCRSNEKNVFLKSPVHDLLNKYVLVQLYTDSVPDRSLSPTQAKEQAERNNEWRDALGDATLPYYLVLAPATDSPLENGKPKGQVLGRRKDLIRDVPDFVRFLEEPLAARRTSTQVTSSALPALAGAARPDLKQ